MVEALEQPKEHSSKPSELAKPTPAPHIASLADAMAGLPGFNELGDAAQAAGEKHDAELGSFLEESKRRAASQSAVANHQLVQVARRWEEDLPPEPDGIATEDPERTPVLFVRTSPEGSLYDYGIADGDNWAKWGAKASGDAISTQLTTKVSFFHLWQNPRRRRIVADVYVGLSADGHLSTHGNGMGFPAGLFWDNSQSDVAVNATLTAWALWVPDLSRAYQSVAFGSSHASGGVFGDSGAAAVSEGAELQGLAISVPGREYLLIEVALEATFDCYNGSAEADFASENSFIVRCPYCIVIP